MRSRPAIAKTIVLLLLSLKVAGMFAAMCAGAAANTRRSETVETRTLDRFLDHHPLLEDKLRVTPRLVSDAAFLAQNPDLRDFAGSNPAAAARLSADPRHLLYRALLRQASAPLPIRELEVFGGLLDQEPALERVLSEKPESIRNPEFLQRQRALHEFLLGQPRLAAVYLTPTVIEKSN